MKSTTYILGLAVLALASCSSSKDVVYNGDGVYYNPKKHLEADKAVVVHPTTKLESTSSASSQTNITNNYYGSGGYYSSRISRYNNFDYYPYSCGSSGYGGPTIYISSGWGYNNYSGCHSCGTFYQPYTYYNGCGGGFYNNGYSYYSGYNGYNGYYGNNNWGGWNKNNYFYNPYKNGYNNNNNTGGSYTSTKKYGPRLTSTNTNIPGNGNGNPGKPAVIPSTSSTPVAYDRNYANDKPAVEKRATVVNTVSKDRAERVNTSGNVNNTAGSTGNDYEATPRYRPAQIMSTVEEKPNPVNVKRENTSSTTVINGTTERVRSTEPANNSGNSKIWSTPTYRSNTESAPASRNNSNNNIESTPSTPSRSYEPRERNSTPSYSPPSYSPPAQNSNNNSAPSRGSSGGSSGGSSSGGSSSAPARRGPR